MGERAAFVYALLCRRARSHGALSISLLGAVDRQKLSTGGGGDDFSSFHLVWC